MIDKTVSEALAKLNAIETLNDKEDLKLFKFISTQIFPSATYRCDGVVDKVRGFPVLGFTINRDGVCASILITLIHLKNEDDGLSSKHFEKIKKETTELAKYGSCIGGILTIWEKVDREILSPEEKVDALVNEYTTYDYVLTFV